MDAIEQQRKRLLEDIQALPADVLQEAVDFIARLRQKATAPEIEQPVEQPSEQAPLSAYEIFKDSGLIGCIKDGPPDLAANHRKYVAEYLENKYDHR
jgi:hypothetical protein